MENYRLKGLERKVDEISQQLKEDGLMNCDLEVIGAILFTRHQGEDKRIDKMLTSGAQAIKDAEEFLKNLKSQT